MSTRTGLACIELGVDLLARNDEGMTAIELWKESYVALLKEMDAADNPRLPSRGGTRWEKHVTPPDDKFPEGRPYWYDARTATSVWEDPAETRLKVSGSFMLITLRHRVR